MVKQTLWQSNDMLWKVITWTKDKTRSESTSGTKLNQTTVPCIVELVLDVLTSKLVLPLRKYVSTKKSAIHYENKRAAIEGWLKPKLTKFIKKNRVI